MAPALSAGVLFNLLKMVRNDGWMVDWKTKVALSDEATISYMVSEEISSNAPVVCFIASTGRGPKDFIPLAESLCSLGVRVVLPWPRSIGGSDGPTEDIDFHDLANDAAAALEAEKGDSFAYIAGHAYGCWIARTVAQDRPDLISGLILIAAGGASWRPELSAAIEVAMDYTADEVARLEALCLAFFVERSEAVHWLEGWFPDLVLLQRAARARTTKDSWWRSGSAPILDIIGLCDPFRPTAELDLYKREFGDRVRVVTIEDSSHALPDEKPAEVAKAISGWLNSVRKPSDEPNG